MSPALAKVFRPRPIVATVLLAVVWFALAWRSPTSTHHFAPLVIAAAWGFMAELDSNVAVRAAAGAGVGVAVVTLAALALGDRLMGPTLWGSRPSWPELAGFAVLGGVVTLARARRIARAPVP